MIQINEAEAELLRQLTTYAALASAA
jgi:hypothetical protein